MVTPGVNSGVLGMLAALCWKAAMAIHPARLPVLCPCHLLNVSTHQCADVPFNWRWPAAATGLQQQACCVRYTLCMEGHNRVASPDESVGSVSLSQ